MFTRKSILKKTAEVGGLTLLSKLFGIVREALTIRYLGASALSDSFLTAWKIPNLLRKTFAEGALSAAFVPSLVQNVRKDGPQSIGSLMTLGFIIFESIVLIVCFIIMILAPGVIGFIAPGFSPEQIMAAAKFLYILMPFLFLISSSALLAGALQAVNHFFIPAFGPVILNAVYIMGLLACISWDLPVTALCWFILAGGVAQLIAHIMAYIYYQFGFGIINQDDIPQFKSILIKFFWCLLSMSVVEIGLFIDTSFASYLPKGSLSLIYYANRFMGIPLSIFATAFATILLPYFSRISAYAPRRLGFYVLESTKLVWWLTFPTTLLMMFFSRAIFLTLFLSDKFTINQVDEAGAILITFLFGLFFFAINKILANVYYALHQTYIPGIIAVISVLINTILNWLLMDVYGAVGLAFATTVASILQTILLFIMLYFYSKLPLYLPHLASFAWRYTLQVFLIGACFYPIYYGIESYIQTTVYHSFFIENMGYWLWVSPLCILFMATLFYTRRWFNYSILFLER